MKNSILFRVWVLAGAVLLVSSGWGFEANQKVTIGGTGSDEARKLTVTSILKIKSVNDDGIKVGSNISSDGLVTAAEGIGTEETFGGEVLTNATDDKIPTTAAVKAYVDDAFGISN